MRTEGLKEALIAAGEIGRSDFVTESLYLVGERLSYGSSSIVLDRRAPRVAAH